MTGESWLVSGVYAKHSIVTHDPRAQKISGLDEEIGVISKD